MTLANNLNPKPGDEAGGDLQLQHSQGRRQEDPKFQTSLGCNTARSSFLVRFMLP